MFEIPEKADDGEKIAKDFEEQWDFFHYLQEIDRNH